MSLRTSLATLAILPALLVPLHSQAAQLYTLTVLPDVFRAADMNNLGQIAGAIAFGNDTHAALYANGVITDLGGMGGVSSTADRINDAGAITGTAATGDGGGYRFMYSNGNIVTLQSGLDVRGMNVGGDLVGSVSTPYFSQSAVIYNGGQITRLNNLGTGAYGSANDINDAGQIVGVSHTGAEDPAIYHAYLYSDGVMQDIGGLPGFQYSTASAINNAGQIAGHSEGTPGHARAFLYEHGVYTDVGNLGGAFLDVNSINEHGAFVGSGMAGNSSFAGFVYLDGALVDLNTLIDPSLGWYIDDARVINDSGQILAHGCNDVTCGALRLDLASAVPEPGAALTLVPGLLALAGLRRKRCRNANGKQA